MSFRGSLTSPISVHLFAVWSDYSFFPLCCLCMTFCHPIALKHKSCSGSDQRFNHHNSKTEPCQRLKEKEQEQGEYKALQQHIHSLVNASIF